MSELTSYPKDPDATLEYVWDWSAWLKSDTIVSHTITAVPGITVQSDTATNTAVTVWLTGGTLGAKYEVTCRIVTAGGRTDDRTNTYYIQKR